MATSVAVSYSIPANFSIEIITPLSTEDQLLFGMWPPLRTANGVLVDTRCCSPAESSDVLLGVKMRHGESMVVPDQCWLFWAVYVSSPGTETEEGDTESEQNVEARGDIAVAAFNRFFCVYMRILTQGRLLDHGLYTPSGPGEPSFGRMLHCY